MSTHWRAGTTFYGGGGGGGTVAFCPNVLFRRQLRKLAKRIGVGRALYLYSAAARKSVALARKLAGFFARILALGKSLTKIPISS